MSRSDVMITGPRGMDARIQRCEFYPDGLHRLEETFWGLACDRCGRLAPPEDDEPRPSDVDESLRNEGDSLRAGDPDG